MKTSGRHVVADVWVAELLPMAEVVMLLAAGLKAGGASVVGELVHVFGGDAFTAAYVLEESHLTIHTFPERGYFSLDCYTCGEAADPLAVVAHIVSAFDVCRSEIKMFRRG